VEGEILRAMSRENVEVVRRSTDAYNRRDVDEMFENWAQDAVLDWSNARSFDAGIYRGHGEIRAFTEGFFASWDEVRIELVYGPAEIEDDVLIAENVTYMRGRDGIEVQARSAWLIKMRNGEQTSLKLYQTRQDALESAGLRE
jgi:ketosteroid isomerase-like protein